MESKNIYELRAFVYVAVKPKLMVTDFKLEQPSCMGGYIGQKLYLDECIELGPLL